MEVQLQGNRFYEAQLRAVDRAVAKHEEEVTRRRARQRESDEFERELQLHFPEVERANPYRGKDPHLTQADTLERQAIHLQKEADRLREQSIRTWHETNDATRGEELQETRRSILAALGQ